MQNKQPPHRPNYQYYIGIDCGVTTGFAAWDKEQKKLTHVQSMKIHQAIDLVKAWICDRKRTLVRIEDARLRKWIPKYESESRERGRREGAGSVKRDASIWEDFLTDVGISFELVAPKNNKTKVDAAYFKKMTGWEGVTNEHARDAGMLVFGF